MNLDSLAIDSDIRTASTLPGWMYTDPAVLALARERVFARSWQWIGDVDRVKVPGQVFPFTLLEGLLDEPLVLARDRADQLHCFSNVCTHRGNRVVENEGVETGLRCRYHGRRFGLDGRFVSMPEFEGVVGFPSPADDLPRVPFAAWEKFLFASLAPAYSLPELLGPTQARCGFTNGSSCTFDPTRSRDYLVQANWALYVENYLEGFHIPFVHAGLSGALDYEGYRTELFERSSIQVGIASGGEDVFELPSSSPDQGHRVAAYYVWLFPNTMLNFYPWGVSVNVVRPLAVDRTKVSFLTFVSEPSRLDRGVGGSLDRVEREDEAIVESVQRGLASRLYRRGRYSPMRESGVHHFHRMFVAALKLE